MSDIATKLTYLNTTKSKIKDSINLTGANLTNETFRQYATVLKDTLAHILKNPSPIWDNFPKTTATGSAIQVNTYNSLLDYSLDGNTTQYTTTQSANLFDKSILIGGWVRNSDGYYYNQYTETYNCTPFLKVEPNTTYTIDFYNATGLGSAGIVEFNSAQQSGYIKGTQENQRIITFTTTANTQYIRFTVRVDSKDSVMWVKGSALPSEYVPFVPNSPSPTYPQPINNVTGLQEVEITNGTTTNTYEINLGDIELNKIGNYKDYIFKGKGVNLFDKSTFTIGTIASTDTTRITSMQELYLEQGTYTFSWNGISPYNFAIQGQTIGKPPLSTYPTFTLNSGWQSGSSYSFTITTPLWVDVCLRKNDNSTITINEINNFSYQIVKGTSTTYEPYNAKDKWLLHKEIGKVVLNGTPSWRRSGTKTSGNYYFFEDSLLSNAKFDSNNRFIGIANMGITTNAYQEVQGFDTIWYNNQYVRSRFYSDTTKAMSTSEFATWLSTHNIITYYVLANPTTTEITNSELLEDLDSIELLDGLNNITITGDLSAIMNLTCLEKE